jgi:hypothetical protein
MPSNGNDLSGLSRRESDLPRCGAKARSTGKPCRLPAGFKTPHPGRGRCAHHGGSTRWHIIKDEREQAVELAQAALGRAMQIDAYSAQELAVHLSRGTLEFWRQRIIAEGDRPSQDSLRSYRIAVMDLSRISGRAVDSRVSERQVSLAERAADEVVLVCEAGLAALIAAGVVISNAQRTAYADAVGDALHRLEDEPDGIIEGEVVALPAATG